MIMIWFSKGLVLALLWGAKTTQAMDTASSVGNDVESLPNADDVSRGLNDKWPPKKFHVPGVRRYHEWSFSGAATNLQYTKRADHRPESGSESEDWYYEENYGWEDGEEEYYYGPTDDEYPKRPSETDFQHYDKIPKTGKAGKGGKGGKTNKIDDPCEHFYYEYEQDIEHSGQDESDENIYGSESYGYNKSTKREGKGRKAGKSSKSSKKTKVCTDPPCKYCVGTHETQ